MFHIFREEDVLNEGFRQKVLEEILGKENQDRKNEALKRYEIFRDATKKYVMQSLRKQGFKDSTLKLMEPRASNLSITKKMVKKKARTYNAGVDRTIPNDEMGTKTIQMISDLLGVTVAMKKADEYRQLSRNAFPYVHPIIVGETEADGGMKPVYSLTIRTLHPHQYDVIPDAQNHEIPRCLILSDFPAGARTMGYRNTYSDWNGSRGASAFGGSSAGDRVGDGTDQTIADTPSDSGAGKQAFVWWTARYHFTTDCEGKIIQGVSPADLLNPIKRLPGPNISTEQDGEFWAQGGDDMIDGSVLVNVLLTDASSILSQQGWGQPVYTGNELKGEFEVGPHNVISLITQDGQAIAPSFEFKSTDPHTENWIKLLEAYVALLLTTNNLSPRNIQGKLDGATVASGIAKMIDESESTEDVTDAQAYFQLKEMELWQIISAWLEVYRSTERLIPALQQLDKFDGTKINAKFNAAGVVLSETERVDILQKRKDLGIDTLVELIKRDDPSLTDKQAEDKLLKLVADRLKYAVLFKKEQPNPAQSGEGNAQMPNGGNQAEQNQQQSGA